MPQSHDIVLGGKGYMVVPKSYRRGLDAQGGLGSAPVRQVQREWRGALRPVQAERDRHYASLGLWPVRGAGGAGVTAGPRETMLTVSGFGALARRYGVLHGGRPYVALGGKLWRPEQAGAGLTPANLAGYTQLGATLPQTINGLTTDGLDSLYLSRAGAGYAVWTVGGAAFDTTPTVQLTGCAWYAGSLWGGHRDPVGWRVARVTGPGTIEGNGLPLDSAPRSFLAAKDALYITTAGYLWRLKGQVTGGAFQGECEPVAGYGGQGYAEDGNALAEYDGRVYSWIGGEVCRFYSGGTAPSQWVGTGLVGWACRGLAAAGGLLFAAIVDGPSSAGAGLWCYDGVGWWCLARNPDGTRDYCWPQSTAGFFDNVDLLASGSGSSNVFGWQLRPQATQAGLGAAGELVTSLWQGRDPDALKSWVRIGAEVGWPGADSWVACGVAIDYSTNGGFSWVEAATATASNSAPFTLSGVLPSGTVAKSLALRYRLFGVTDGAPTLTGLWAEYRTVEPIVGKRHWQMEIVAGDETATRDGRRDPRKGQAIAADLWAQWEAQGTLTLRDIDYDLATTERAVRIVGLDEAVPLAADGGRWVESRLKLRLVEV